MTRAFGRGTTCAPVQHGNPWVALHFTFGL